jgi:hypothetical protein
MVFSIDLDFLGASGLNLPQASEVVVRVPDAQDQPVDGLPVVFSAEPSWTQNVSFAPAEARTRHGEARTTFEANTTGVVHIMAHVDHVMREARMTIQSRPSPVGVARKAGYDSSRNNLIRRYRQLQEAL